MFRLDKSAQTPPARAAALSPLAGTDLTLDLAAVPTAPLARRQCLEAQGRALAALQATTLNVLHRTQDTQMGYGLLKASAIGSQLGDLAGALKGLQGSTERFIIVIDLMLAAVDFLDTQTFATAQACVQGHLQGAKVQLDSATSSLQCFAPCGSSPLASRLA
jgi:hypothetical protein